MNDQPSDFHLASPPPEHDAMRRLVENAFAFLDPTHEMIDAESGYPLEGWNQDPKRGLFLRSFTQITAIGEWIELLAIIAAGKADNPFISRENALEQLQLAVTSLRADQGNPELSSRGLLVNFLGLEDGRRIGPLTTSVVRQDFIDGFGEEQGAAIWQALIDKEWLKPQNENSEGVVLRSESFGSDYFDGALKPYEDDTMVQRIMDILDERVVLVAYGDNANLSASVAKAIGALLNESIADSPMAVELRGELEAFLEAQQEGYRGLIDEPAGMFSFGRDENTGRFFGWNNDRDEWVVGHHDYLVNEFRDPSMFLVTRFDLPMDLLGNLGFKMKSYETSDGRTLFTLAPFAGSAFQVFGLDLAMPHLDSAVWRMILGNAVDIEIDFATRNGHPGFLSESYSGEGTEYTGEVGMPKLAVARKERITTAPSLYTLGTAYQIDPDAMNDFVGANWPVIETLLTDHGPWEGYHTVSKSPIEFQTSAHTLSLLLGALAEGPGNMRRYLESKNLGEDLRQLYRPGPAFDFLDESVSIGQWSADGASIVAERTPQQGLEVRSESQATAGIIFTVPADQLADLSGGTLEIRYRAEHTIPDVAILPKRSQALLPGVIQNEILTSFAASKDGESTTLTIPLPTTPGLRDTAVLEINFNPATAEGTHLSIEAIRFVPLAD